MGVLFHSLHSKSCRIVPQSFLCVGCDPLSRCKVEVRRGQGLGLRRWGLWSGFKMGLGSKIPDVLRKGLGVIGLGFRV